jgi:hypothetical protein
MSKEKRPLEPLLHLEDIVRLAEEVLMRDGGHLPTLIVEGTTDSLITQLVDLPGEPELRQALLFQVGVLLASDVDLGSLRQVFMITEGWLSLRRDGKPPMERPSQDPEREEVLVVAAFFPPSGRQAVELRRMIRNAQGELVEVSQVSKPEGATEAENPLLEAFVLGYTLAGHTSLR